MLHSPFLADGRDSVWAASMQGRGLGSSRWAPKQSQSLEAILPPQPVVPDGSHSHPHSSLGPTPARNDSQVKERIKAYRTVNATLNRLKYRASFLLESHRRAIHNETSCSVRATTFYLISYTGRANIADQQFKNEFFDYYVLVERCLLALMACFDHVIRAEHRSTVLPPPSTATGLDASVYSDTPQRPPKNALVGDSRVFPSATHRFHANLLEALDDIQNPFHKVLGEGDVRLYIGLAKEFRNKWKQADMVDVEEHIDQDMLRKRYKTIVEGLQLDRMLESILVGLQNASELAREHVLGTASVLEVDMLAVEDRIEVEMEDAMDWD